MYDPHYSPNDSTGPRKSRFWALRRGAQLAAERWQWPLMKLGDRTPIVLAEHINGTHRGVDLGYESRPCDELLFVPVFAVHAGEVVFCGEGANGFAVTLRDVTGNRATFYSRLSKVFVADTSKRRRSAEWVRAGDVIAYAAKSAIHIRFALVSVTGDRELLAVDPKPDMATWKLPTIHDLTASAVATAA